MSEEVLNMVNTCNYCKRDLEAMAIANDRDETIVYKHPKHGIVCEYCPPFKDGGLVPVKEGAQNEI